MLVITYHQYLIFLGIRLQATGDHHSKQNKTMTFLQNITNYM